MLPAPGGLSIARSTIRHVHGSHARTALNSQCSFLFDVTSKTHVSVCALTFVPGTPEGDYEIWSTPQPHENVHQCQKAWLLVAKGSHSSQRGQKFRVQFNRDVTITASARHAFYIQGHNSNAVCFSTDTPSAISGESEEVVIHLGHFKSYPWESQLSTGPFGHNGMQAFVGSLEYNVLQTHAVDHAESMAHQLWDHRPFPDAHVVAVCGKTFAVHRAVLAAASPVFEAAWRQPLKEREERVIRIEAYAEAVEALLCFIYTGSVNVNADPGDMLSLAHLYSLHALVRGSAVRLANQVSTQNAVASVRALRPYRTDATVAESWKALVANIQTILAGDAGLLEEVLLSV